MKNLKISWKLVALFVLGAIGSGLYVTRSRAFTLIEGQYLPYIELVASQSAQINVSNVSPNDLEATITTYGMAGHMISTQTTTLAPGATTSLVVIAKPTGSLSFRTAISLSAAGSAVSDVMTFDKTTGEVIAISPGLLLPAVQ